MPFRIFKCQFVRVGICAVKNVDGRIFHAFFHQLFLDARQVISGARIDSHAIFCKQAREIPPFVD